MRIPLSGFLLVLFILIFTFPTGASENTVLDSAGQNQEGGAFAFYFENDSRSIGGPGSDQAYSNGVKFSYIYAENRVPEWAESYVEKLSALGRGFDKPKTNFALSLGQQIYTPNNIHEKNLILDDRPYAGWLYLGFAVSFKEAYVGHFFETNLGIIGPSALGKEVQNNYHDLIDVPVAEGWSHSLHDEPTLQFSYQKRYKAFARKYFDFIPYYGGSLGNVQVAAHVGGLVRFGVQLPDDFGPSRPSASEGDSFVTPLSSAREGKKSYFLFAGARGSAFAHNIFLDGNTFRDSHHVKKYPLIFETEFGAEVQILPYAIAWRFVTRSPEFEERSRFNSFASLNFVYLF